MTAKVTITGLQEAQRGNLETVAAMKPGGAFGRAVQYSTIEAHRYAVSITHVITGSLRASHRIRITGLRGEIYIDPEAVNPRTGGLTSKYGPFEHKRGGTHAFYARTEQEAGNRIARAAAAGFLRELP